MRHKIHRLVNGHKKYIIRCPYCHHAWWSDNKDLSCIKCHACIDENTVKMLDKLSKALMKG